jgi:regulator of sirC expression with transglutaminase-like and TPR domain
MPSGEIRASSPNHNIAVLREQTQLFVEVCHFTQDLNPLWPTRSMMEKLKAISHPVIERITPLATQKQKFEYLTQTFFEELGFQFSPEGTSLQSCFLPQVLSSREGPISLLMLLFCSLAEEAGIRVQVSSCRRRFLLKVHLDTRCHIVDFKKRCHYLEPFEIVELVNKGFDFSNGHLASDSLVIEYLTELKNLSRQENRLQILSLVHSYLMRYQPFNLKHLSARAAVAYETGDYKTAIEDIRSYFLYKQPEFSNVNLKKIYKRALKHLKQQERPRYSQ